MRAKQFQKLFSIIFFVCSTCLMASYTTMPDEGFTISYFVNRSTLVLVGEVINTTFVFRKNLPPQYTTDVTVRPIEIIKGSPNIGKNFVRFMIPGGEGPDPKTGKILKCIVAGAPKYKIGEKALFFLKKSKYLGDVIPYGGLIAGTWGKRKLVDGFVTIPYTVTLDEQVEKKGRLKHKRVLAEVQLPVDLTVQIAKGVIKNHKAIEAIEKQIVNFAKRTLPEPGKPFLGRPKLDIKLIKSIKTDVEKP